MIEKKSRFVHVNTILMVIFCLLFLYPLVYTISMSLSSAQAILEGRVVLLPVETTTEAYRALMKDASIIKAFLFTVKLTISGVAASIVLTLTTAYPLSRQQFRGKNSLLRLIIATMYFSGGLIPTYMLVKGLGLTNTIGALIFPTAIDTFLLIIAISYFRELPVELEEAAKMEGCGNFTIFLKVMLPLSLPVVATLVIFYAVSYWNTFFNALIYMQSPSKYTLQIKLYQVLNVFTDSLTNQLSSDVSLVVIPENLKGATVVLTVLPILAVYPWMQKYFIKGVTIGALKG